VRVNQRQLSEILGVSQVTLTEWQKATPALPMTERATNGLENEYETEKVIAWCVQRELARAHVETPRDRLDRIRAAREELGLRRDVGELVNLAILEPMLDRYVEEVSNTVDGLPEKYALLMQQVTDPDGQHQLLRTMVREIRDALGNFDFAAADASPRGGDSAIDFGAAPPDHPALPAAA
jgi:phage terminase Nu1 subunit (DNA packaging protein)